MENKKQYEVSFLLRQEYDIEILMTALKNIGAEIISEGKILEIRLTYPIKKIKAAHFGFLIFSASASCLKELRDFLMMNENILRFLIIVSPARKDQLAKKEISRPLTSPSWEKEENEEIKIDKQVSNEELNKKLEEILS